MTIKLITPHLVKLHTNIAHVLLKQKLSKLIVAGTERNKLTLLLRLTYWRVSEFLAQ